MEAVRLADGLWRWTAPLPGGVYYEAPEAVVLFDPLLPAGEEQRFLEHLDRDVERLGLPVSILLTAARNERSAPFLRKRYRADDRVPATVEVYPADSAEVEQLAYFIRPHRALVVAGLDDWPAAIYELPVELVLVSNPARRASPPPARVPGARESSGR